MSLSSLCSWGEHTRDILVLQTMSDFPCAMCMPLSVQIKMTFLNSSDMILRLSWEKWEETLHIRRRYALLILACLFMHLGINTCSLRLNPIELPLRTLSTNFTNWETLKFPGVCSLSVCSHNLTWENLSAISNIFWRTNQKAQLTENPCSFPNKDKCLT